VVVVAEVDGAKLRKAMRACETAKTTKEAMAHVAVEELKGAMNWVSTSLSFEKKLAAAVGANGGALVHLLAAEIANAASRGKSPGLQREAFCSSRQVQRVGS
jgi:hypothetical protein